jgi:hypothetical protein
MWDGETAVRVSVSAWKTDRDAAGRAADVIVELAAQVRQRASR